MLRLEPIRWSKRMCLAACVAGIALSSSPSPAQDEKPAATERPATEGPTEKPDPYALPEGNDAQELSLFMRRLMRMPPPQRTQEGFQAHIGKISQVMDELLARELDESALNMAIQLKFAALSALNRNGDETAPQQIDEFLAKLKQDPRPDVAALARQLEFSARIGQLPVYSADERKQLVDDVATYLQEGDVGPQQFTVANQVASILEQVDRELAITAYNVFAKHVESSTNAEIAEYAELMRASARRVDLPGKPIEVKASRLDGEPFDIAQYKGKVVLVDFWATWCGPCIAELPNVKQHYAMYHDRGFEVVGISLDQNPERLQKFLEEEEIPWVTLFESDPEKQFWNHPVARHYGISGIPAAILVNQEGNVVSLEARGEELHNQLEQLLGPAEPPGEGDSSRGAKP